MPFVLGNWFVKKVTGRGKRSHKRWFELWDNEIRYFVGIGQDGRGKNEKGNIQLGPATMVAVDGKLLSIFNPDRTWQLESESTPDVAQKWMEKIREQTDGDGAHQEGGVAVHRSSSRFSEHGVEKETSPMTRNDAFQQNKTELQGDLTGWFVKGGQKRFFVLAGISMTYYESAGTTWTPKGCMDLMETADITATSHILSIKCGDRSWNLQATDGEDQVIRWHDVLQSLVTGLSLEENDENTDHDNARARQFSESGSLESVTTATTVENPVFGTDSASHGDHVRSQHGEILSGGNADSDDLGADAPLTGKHHGAWFTDVSVGAEEGKRAYYQICDGKVHIFGNADSSGDGVAPIDTIVLPCDTHTMVEDRQLTIATAERVWVLECERKGVCDRWCAVLREAVHSQASRAVPATAGDTAQAPAAPTHTARAPSSTAPVRARTSSRSLPKVPRTPPDRSTTASVSSVRAAQLNGNTRNTTNTAATTDETAQPTPVLNGCESNGAPEMADSGQATGSAQAVTTGAPTMGAWFTKRGGGKLAGFKKRYVELNGSDVYYYLGIEHGSPHGLKGTIKLTKESVVEQIDARLTIQCPARTWLLIASDGEVQARLWCSRMQEVIDGLRGTRGRAKSLALSGANLGMESATDDHDDSAVHSAWFVKKGRKRGGDRKRFFVLKDTELQYYVGEGSDGLGADQKGSIELLDESVIAANGDILTITNPDRVWNLAADSSQVAEKWADLLNGLDRGLESCDLNPQPHAWFMKTNIAGKEQPRFCEFAGTAVHYYLRSSQVGFGIEQRGSIVLTPDTTLLVDAGALTLETLERTWCLKSDDDDQVDAWATLLRTALADIKAREGVPAAPADGGDGRARSDTIDPTAMRAHLAGLVASRGADALSYAAVKQELVDKFGSRVVKAFRQDILTALPTTTVGDDDNADNVGDNGDGGGGDDADDVEVLSGWFLKKAGGVGHDRRRYCELHDDGVRYFETVEAAAGVAQKGTIALVRTTTVRSEGNVLFIVNADRTWELQGATTEEVDVWVTALQQAVAELSYRGTDGTCADLFAGGHGVWLTKHKSAALKANRRRYFTIEHDRDTDALFFAYYAALTPANVPKDRKGAIQLEDSTTVDSQGVQLTVKNVDARWVLTAANASTARRWRTLLQNVLVERNTRGDDGSRPVPVLVRVHELVGQNDVLPMDAAEELLLHEYGQPAFERFEDDIRAVVQRSLEQATQQVFDGVWLVKDADGSGRSRRRFFELDGHEFKYFGRVQRGRGVDLKGQCTISIASAISSEGALLMVANADRTWRLRADTAEVATVWADRLVNVQQGLLRAFDSTLQDMATVDRLSYEQIKHTLVAEYGVDAFERRKDSVLRVAPAPAVAATLGGDGLWMLKQPEGKGKAKRRWFQLVGTELRYFADVDGAGAGLDQRGAIELLPQTQIVQDDMRIVVTNPDRTWDLTAETGAAAVAFEQRLRMAQQRDAGVLNASIDTLLAGDAADAPTFAAVKDAVVAEHGADAFESRKGSIARRVAEARAEAGLDTVDPAADADGAGGAADADAAAPTQSGWLVKKAAGVGKKHRRWFQLVGSELQYFVSEAQGHGVNQKGVVEVTSGTRISVRRTTVVVVNPERTWELEAVDEAAAVQWEAWLAAAQSQLRALFYNRVNDLKDRHGDDLRFTELEMALRSEFGADMLNHERDQILRTTVFAAPTGDAVVEDAADDSLHHAAWFVKKAKLGADRKRYFVLVESELQYFESSNNGRGVNQKGSIEILPTTVITTHNHILTITCPGDRTWTLLAENPAQAKFWKGLLHDAQDVAEAPLQARLQTLLDAAAAADTVPAYADLKEDLVGYFGVRVFEKYREVVIAAIREVEKASDGAGVRRGVPTRCGWMLKKGKRRWFELHACDIQYFLDEKRGQGVELRGVITITSASRVVTNDAVVSIINPDRVWNLTAASVTEASQWEGVLGDLRPRLMSSLNHRLGDTLNAAGDDDAVGFSELKRVVLDEYGENTYLQHQGTLARALLEANIVGRGGMETAWFFKKAAKYGKDQKRFFELHGNVLRYFQDMDAAKTGKHKGAIHITPASVLTVDGKEVHIGTANREWVLWPLDGQERTAVRWEGLLIVARELLIQDMTAFLKKFAAQIKQNHVRGPTFRLLKDSIMEEFGEDEFYGFEPQILAMAKTLELSLGDGQDSNSTTDDDVEFSGWLLKQPAARGKARRRFFELEGTELRYFEDCHHGRGVVEKGLIDITRETTVVQDAESFVVRCGDDGDRDYELSADTRTEADAWVHELTEAVAAAVDEAQSLDIGESELDLFPGMGAWFRKRGKAQTKGSKGRLNARSRYFTLALGESSKNLRFNYYGTCDSDVPTDKKGYIPISSKSTMALEGKTLVITNPDVLWRLTADEADTASRWRRLLTRAVTERAMHADNIPLLGRVAMLLAATPAAPPSLDAVLEALRGEYPPDVLEYAADDIKARVTQAHIDVDRPHLPGAWFVKKADGKIGKDRRRWFELCHNELRYFAGETKGRGTNRKGSITIAHFTKIIFSSKELVITNPARTYELTGESIEDVAAWGIALRKLVRLLGPEFKASNTDTVEQDTDVDGNALCDWFEIEDENSGHLSKRYVILMGSELRIHRQANGMGGGTGLVDTITLGCKTAISVGNVTLKLQTEHRSWELHAQKRVAQPPVSAPEVAREWAQVLRERRNDKIKQQKERKKARAEADAEKTGGAPSRAAETPILGTAARDKIKETMMDSATLDTNKPAEEATATTAAEAVDDGDDGDQGDSPRRRRAFVPGNRCCIIC
eukprot:m.1577547 g.1577547  ORF g.1577547 m.1577547 type:complete len:2794 (+) comp25311_c0_seq11:414-8795(+)